ncbi:MAG: hypothetical protein HKM04_01050 [Legionellales bacterium]|nr:hypothetical protein [Legionellales bacterium]
MAWYGNFAPYVPVAERKENAAREVATMKKKGKIVNPVVITGRNIASTCWGKAWCMYLETFSDYDNRLPRGRTYVRNGSVIDLQIGSGEIRALVSGSSLYKIKITIAGLADSFWQGIVKQCAGQIDSLIELLQGKFSHAVMEVMTQSETGLFPAPNEIKLSCSCPDYAAMCKHVAAVMYGVGARLDQSPHELFVLRQVDPMQLINQSTVSNWMESADTSIATIQDDDLSALFGIDLQQNSTIQTDIIAVPVKEATNSIKRLKVLPKKKHRLSNAEEKLCITIRNIKKDMLKMKIVIAGSSDYLGRALVKKVRKQ